MAEAPRGRLPGGSAGYVRRSARVLLLNGDQVLLLRSRFRRPDPEVEWAWFAPGGGVEKGESVLDAAVREIAEETGVVLEAPELVPFAFSLGDGRVGDVVGLMRDDIFVAECGRPDPSTAGLEAHERDAFGEYRWWNLDQLQATTERVFPNDLAKTLISFVEAPNWDRPVQLPW